MNEVVIVNAADAASESFTKLTQSDLHTFNEYRYRITEQFFELRNKFELKGSLDATLIKNIANLAKQGVNYLPDNLENKNIYAKLKTALDKGLLYPENESNYNAIIVALQEYLEKVTIQKIT